MLAIDPLALVLRHDIYIAIHLPNPPPPIGSIREQIRETAKRMTPDEKMKTIAKVHALRIYVQALEEEFGRG